MGRLTQDLNAAKLAREDSVAWARNEERWSEREQQLDNEVMLLEAQVSMYLSSCVSLSLLVTSRQWGEGEGGRGERHAERVCLSPSCMSVFTRRMRTQRADEEMVTWEEQVSSLKHEAAAMQEQLEDKESVMKALEQAISQALSRENARAGGGAEALSKSLVAAKVENSELARKLKKAMQAESEMRVALSQQQQQRSASRQASPHKPARVSAAGNHALNIAGGSHTPAPLSCDNSPVKGGRLSLQAHPGQVRSSAESEGAEGGMIGAKLAAAAAEAQAEFSAEEDSERLGQAGHVRALEKWLDRALRLQNECEAAVLGQVAGLVRAVGQAARAPPTSVRVGPLVET